VFDQALPVTGGQGQINGWVCTDLYSGDFFGGSFNVTASLPYAEGYLSRNCTTRRRTSIAPAWWIRSIASPSIFSCLDRQLCRLDQNQPREKKAR
jgi:hypothetical protein